MATSMGSAVLHLTRSLLRQSPGIRASSALSVVHCQQVAYVSDDKSHTQTHVPNFRRTNAEIHRLTRKQKNFLHPDTVDKHRHSVLQSGTENVEVETEVTAPREYRYVMPEFLPNPNWETRDKVLEKLERRDMLKRRAVIEIPEFYVGSIMAVTVTDPHAPGSKNRFVGICIDRGGTGLRAYFVLRNVVDGLGVEVMYEMYSPTILSIETLKLEKRLDEQLYYLRDALPVHSTIPFDMDPVQLPKGATVPVNTEKVKMRPSREWEARWERFNFQGMQPYELSEGRIRRLGKEEKHVHPNDLIHEYRGKINEDEEERIMAEVYKVNQVLEAGRKGSRTTLKKRK